MPARPPAGGGFAVARCAAPADPADLLRGRLRRRLARRDVLWHVVGITGCFGVGAGIALALARGVAEPALLAGCLP